MAVVVHDVSSIRWFKEIGIEDIPIVGGKNASLGEMYRELAPQGVKVPNGFAITADAYRGFLRVTKLDRTIEEILHDLNTQDLANLRQRGRQVREAILAATLPTHLQQAISEAYVRLSSGSHDLVDVAVRSSATAEDLPDASFAGQQETYLGVEGADAVCEHVVHCWASFFSERALFYRRHKGSLDDLGMAVVVQRMVEAEKAGVLFTVDPVQRRRDQMIVEAIHGLGERLVAGEVTPDHYVVDRQGAVKREHLASSGTLHPEELLRLAELGRQLEGHFGGPQDVEWAIAGGEVFLLQSRPVTTL